MTTRPDLNADHIRDLLAHLGDTPDAVANSLRLRGFVGVRDDGCNCPVANYLRAHGVDEVNVTRTDIADDRTVGVHPGYWSMPTPGPIAEFIEAFDNACKYDDLAVDDFDEVPTP